MNTTIPPSEAASELAVEFSLTSPAFRDDPAATFAALRAMIADPDLVTKASEGREAEIRPCVGTSMGCVANFMTTGRLQCVVNVAAGTGQVRMAA